MMRDERNREGEERIVVKREPRRRRSREEEEIVLQVQVIFGDRNLMLPRVSCL